MVKENQWSKKVLPKMCSKKKPAVKEKCVVKNQCSKKNLRSKKISAHRKNLWSKNLWSKKISAQRKSVLKKSVVKEYVRSNLRSKNQWALKSALFGATQNVVKQRKKCGQNSALPKNMWSKKIINNSPHRKGITMVNF